MDYFTVKQNYYTGNYSQVLKEIDVLGADDTTLFYKARSQIALGSYESNASAGQLGASFDSYNAFLKSKKIEDVSIKEDSASNYELVLLASANAIVGDYETASQLCNKGIDSDEEVGKLELLLLAVEISLLNEKPTIAKALYDNFVNQKTAQGEFSSEDELIVNLAESYIKFFTNVDTTSSNFYYYSEISQSFSTWSAQLRLLNSHLQQGHLTEAQDIVKVLESEYYSVQQKEQADLFKPELLVQKITLSAMQDDGNIESLRTELKSLAPEHAYLKNNEKINNKFDELVVKYSS
ncbi:hypothetical protein TPHA_0P00770 [Tetrapisispora phaffii CBS 4417]|uniref:Coatomer subunit epsilon n=1 Tax=Tetrapisispora phaffii (strain ATCC 24235 / CBS 4417 / NBRC 1672 / NRRL Y-8282 / UCD 70-5) TaxID=1071381 RepID=G8C257_TETPH|nr:hypothetical protein TPHA_0P00770 [Tetrapisispora phaffii CBS 4417]CCE66235.1 hypothetical protein TPHA_0P00770 [Tetrapisispora phaffii CBS 4417]